MVYCTYCNVTASINQCICELRAVRVYVGWVWVHVDRERGWEGACKGTLTIVEGVVGEGGVWGLSHLSSKGM